MSTWMIREFRQSGIMTAATPGSGQCPSGSVDFLFLRSAVLLREKNLHKSGSHLLYLLAHILCWPYSCLGSPFPLVWSITMATWFLDRIIFRAIKAVIFCFGRAGKVRTDGLILSSCNPFRCCPDNKSCAVFQSSCILHHDNSSTVRYRDWIKWVEVAVAETVTLTAGGPQPRVGLSRYLSQSTLLTCELTQTAPLDLRSCRIEKQPQEYSKCNSVLSYSPFLHATALPCKQTIDFCIRELS